MKPHPCWFCRSRKVDVDCLEVDDPYWYVSCPRCFATGPEADTQADAIEKWNNPSFLFSENQDWAIVPRPESLN